MVSGPYAGAIRVASRGYFPRWDARRSLRRLNQSRNTISVASSVNVPIKMSAFVINVPSAAGRPETPAVPTSPRLPRGLATTEAPAAGTAPEPAPWRRGSRVRPGSLTAPYAGVRSIVASSFAYDATSSSWQHERTFVCFSRTCWHRLLFLHPPTNDGVAILDIRADARWH